MVAVCRQLLNNYYGHDMDAQLPNPFWHPRIKALRPAFLEYHGKHPERVAVLQRQPRRVSIPKCAWKQAATILQTWQQDERDPSWQSRKSVDLIPKFRKNDLDNYVNLCPKRVAPEQLLARGEGQTVSFLELHDLLLFMKLECAYMKGCDICWDAEGHSDGEGEGRGNEAPADNDPSRPQGPGTTLPKCRSASPFTEGLCAQVAPAAPRKLSADLHAAVAPFRVEYQLPPQAPRPQRLAAAGAASGRLPAARLATQVSRVAGWVRGRFSILSFQSRVERDLCGITYLILSSPGLAQCLLKSGCQCPVRGTECQMATWRQ
jgi:hypothetical protein